MKVTCIARTSLEDLPESVKGTKMGNAWWDLGIDSEFVHDSDVLAEFAGRACYQSWDMPNPKTATNPGYMENIISQGHFSVLEHASATFYVEGVSRSLTHELIRHRHLSYSELSQRYVDMADAEMVVPPAIREALTKHGVSLADWVENFTDLREGYQTIVDELTEDGYTRKRAREAARSIMPNATETKIVVTGNMRAWRDMLQKRWHVAADAEIREFAGIILAHLREIAPNSVQDIPDKPYGSED